jgi:hypothetical protein
VTEVFLSSDLYIIFKYFGPIRRWRIEMAHLPACLRVSGLLGFWLRPSSGILKNTKEHTISEKDLFPSSDDGVGDTYSVGSIRKS